MTKKKRIQVRKENARERKAFKQYVDLKLESEDDPFGLIADTIGVKKGTVYNWSSRFNWAERYEEIEREAHEKMKKDLAKDIASMKMKAVQHNIRRLEEMMKAEMPIAEEGLDYVRQHDILLKSFLLQTGEVTDRIESNTTAEVKLSMEEQKMIQDLSISVESMVEEYGDSIEDSAIERTEIKEIDIRVEEDE